MLFKQMMIKPEVNSEEVILWTAGNIRQTKPTWINRLSPAKNGWFNLSNTL